MAFSLPDLPYSQDALEPHISARTLEFHHGKHHKAYIDKLNNLIAGTDLGGKTLETIISETSGDESRSAIFNNAAQIWNHSFFWQCLTPNGGGSPTGKLASMIESSFGSLDNLLEELQNAGAAQFGSGWAWLVQKDDGLAVTKTLNADNPLAHGQKALFTIDVWEHAYYLDYQNRRPDYLKTVLSRLINWDFVSSNLPSAQAASARK